uniref:Uncharacterized protein MANES_04G135600 n=2 Tax=Rhizophora mucronata TaxID=61149 RepID=A0A2P2L0X2_RHIMU
MHHHHSQHRHPPMSSDQLIAQFLWATYWGLLNYEDASS